MRRLRLKETFEYPGDVERIVKVFADRGFDISPAEAQEAWSRYSSGLAAGWLMMPDEDEYIFTAVRTEFEDLDEPEKHFLIFGCIEEPVGRTWGEGGKADVLAEEPEYTFKEQDVETCPICHLED